MAAILFQKIRLYDRKKILGSVNVIEAYTHYRMFQ